jgi:hypothetical protein
VPPLIIIPLILAVLLNTKTPGRNILPRHLLRVLGAVCGSGGLAGF